MTQIEQELKKKANKEKAVILAKFFKTGKGEYGEGDIFLGITVPQQRKIAKKHANLTLKEISKLLKSKIHEFRLTALLILIEKYKKTSEKKKKLIYWFYLKHLKFINNWDLVDLSCPQIIGSYLQGKNKKQLYKLANSSNLWQKRIAIISTHTFIRNGNFADALKISELLLNDEHDLIHKAVGWMLREIGKRDQKTEEKFLEKHCKKMPRTMLRYAIEKFGEKKKKVYMSL